MKQLLFLLLLFSVSCTDNDNDNICEDLKENIVGTWQVRDVNLDIEAGTVTFVSDNTGFSSPGGAFSFNVLTTDQTDFTWSLLALGNNNLQITYQTVSTTGALEVFRQYESIGMQCDEIILFQASITTAGLPTTPEQRYVLTPL